jgi:hypothetical protein
LAVEEGSFFRERRKLSAYRGNMSKASTCLWHVSKYLSEIDTFFGRVDRSDVSGGENF